MNFCSGDMSSCETLRVARLGRDPVGGEELNHVLTANQQRVADVLRQMQEWTQVHGEWRTRSCINLVAAHNVMSPSARAALASRLADKPVSGFLGKRNHTGGRYVDLIEAAVVELARELFGAAVVEYRPMAGNTANDVVIYATVRPGDTVLILPAGVPSHDSHRVYTQYAGARTVEIPYDYEGFDVDLDGLQQVVRAERPRLMIIGTHMMLFPYRLRAIREIADEAGSLLLYDAAHPLGLMAGGQFQDPLGEGAHVVTGSTQKTLPGPIGGLVITNDKELGKAITAAASALLSNYQNNRVLALGITIAEMLAFGQAYASACVSNALALAEQLASEGLALLGTRMGYTKSNQVIVDAQDGSEPLARALESVNIMTTIVRLPSATARPERPADGIRIGVQEMTRRGMGPGEMRTVGWLIARTARGEALEKIKVQVQELAESFQEVHYCFESPQPIAHGG